MAFGKDYQLYRTWWKHSRTKTHGYHKSYVARTPAGDILRAEYNFKDELVRLYLQIESEDKKEYVAIIKKGQSIREKDVTNNSNISIKKKVAPFKAIFSSLPDDDLLRSLSGIYGISRVSLGREEFDLSPDRTGEYSTRENRFGEAFFERLKRFRFTTHRKKPLRERIKERFWGEVFDAGMGAALSVLIYLYSFDFVILGAGIGALGFFFGGLDWKLRKRAPLLSKVILFLMVGSYFFYEGYTKY